MTAPPVLIEIAWDARGFLGPALAAVDTLRSVNTLAALRGRRSPPLVWRWLAAPGARAPAGLPRPAQAVPRRLPELLLLPGWLARSGPHLDSLAREAAWLASRARQVHARGGAVLALHTGVVLLADAGLLDAREAVVPWPFLPTLARHAPKARLRGDRAWIGEDRLWTSDSPVLATEMLLDALTRLPQADASGRASDLAELAAGIRPVLLHAPDRQQAGVQVLGQATTRRVPPGAVERARRHLEDHLEQAYDLDRLARAAATSPRTLLRHFEAGLSQTPLAYLHGLRMARAKVLLETTYLPVDQVGQACGYAHAGTFRRQFAAATGETPAAYRERHRLRVRRREWGSDLAG